jgi:hypothetical protein
VILTMLRLSLDIDNAQTKRGCGHCPHSSMTLTMIGLSGSVNTAQTQRYQLHRRVVIQRCNLTLLSQLSAESENMKENLGVVSDTAES